MIEVTDLHYKYPGAATEALSGIDLTVDRKQLLGLLGPNGAGKSTLISLLIGLRSPDSGSVRVDFGQSDLSGVNSFQSVAWVPQDYAFYPRFSVLENLTYFGQILGLAGDELDQQIEESVRVTGLEQAVSKRAAVLSGGMKRRLNIAISLLGKPACLILDEPTVGIDPQSRHFILEAVRQINKGGTTVIYSSHYMEEVQNLCDTIAILDHGKILAFGSLNQLLTDADSQAITNIRLNRPLSTPELLGETFELSEDRLLLSGMDVSTIELVNQLQQLSTNQVSVQSVDSGVATLEQLFIQLTDESLRD